KSQCREHVARCVPFAIALTWLVSVPGVYAQGTEGQRRPDHPWAALAALETRHDWTGLLRLLNEEPAEVRKDHRYAYYHAVALYHTGRIQEGDIERDRCLGDRGLSPDQVSYLRSRLAAARTDAAPNSSQQASRKRKHVPGDDQASGDSTAIKQV